MSEVGTIARHKKHEDTISWTQESMRTHKAGNESMKTQLVGHTSMRTQLDGHKSMRTQSTWEVKA